MKKFTRIVCHVAALLLCAAPSFAQTIGEKENILDYSDKRYLAGAIPMKDGKVVFNRQLDITGIATQTAMELTQQWAKVTLAANGYNGKIYNIDNNAGTLIMNIDGNLIFKSSAFQLDKATISLILDIRFNNDRCMLTFRNIRYLYAINPNNKNMDVIMADNWITDKEALNKAGTKMYAMNGKFRIRTVQLIDYLTESLRNGLNARNIKGSDVSLTATAETVTNTASATVEDKAADAKAADAKAADAKAVDAKAVVAESAQANTDTAIANRTTSDINTGTNTVKHYNFTNDMTGFEKISPLEIEGNAIKMISKEWMLVTAGTESDFNMLTASWGGFGELYNRPVAICFIRQDRYTFNYIDNGDTFTLSFYSEDFREVLNYCGSASGRNEDKVKGSRLTPLMLPNNKGIAFRQANLIIECKKLVSMPITPDAINQPDVRAERTKYPLHKMFIGEIVAVYKKR